MEENERVRCRKCRKILLSNEFRLRDAHGQEYHNTVGDNSEESEVVCASVKEHSCLYISEESFPDFILIAVDESSWTKGKIHCPGCQARLGSFNFVSGSQCACGSCVLPQVHILRSKIDWMKVGEALPRPVSYPDHCVSLSPATISFPTLSPEEEGTTTDTTDTKSSSLLLDLPNGSPQTENCSIQRRVRYRELKDNEGMGEEDITGEQMRDEIIFLLGDSASSSCFTNATSSLMSYSTTSSSSATGFSSTTATATSSSPDIAVDIKPCCFEVLKDELSSSTEEESSEDDEDVEEDEDEEEAMIPNRLTCPVCLDLLYSPLITCPCSHTFCEPCLRRLARPDPTHTHCPLCRQVIGHCMPAPEVGSEARERFPELYMQRRQFEIQHNSHHLPLPWLRNFRLRGVYEEGQSWVERAGGWQTVAVLMSLNILGIGLLLYLGRPVKVEPDPHLYPASTRSWHHP